MLPILPMSNTTNNSIRKNEIRVRIAPSPTGIPHIGNSRTALFNYLFARHNKGKFILRIEDTDQKRIVKGAKEAIFEILDWLGLTPNEVYIQSERLREYKKHAEQLLEKGVAYKEKDAIRFEMPKAGETFWNDLIGNKHISFKNNTQEDFVILKSDGFPTYNFANVIDDHLMEISHIIRGEEFISSTPKHIHLYKAFGWSIPNFAHLPIVLGPDKTKLSKRHGAKSVLEYRDEGYLKEALLNYMALLGWRFAGAVNDGEGTPHVVPEREIMSLDFMINFFDLKDVNTASPIFDIKKLDWFNGVWIRKIAKEKPDDFKSRLINFIGEGYSVELVEQTTPLVYERMKTLADYLPLCEFFFKIPKKYEVDIHSKATLFKKMYDVLSQIDTWKALAIGDKMQKTAQDLKVKNSEFFMLLRVAITGKKVSPPLNESMEILGKKTVLARLQKAIL